MEYKNKNLDINLQMNNDNLQAYQTIMRLKNLFRQGWLKRGLAKDQCESVADHSFGTAILALLITPAHLDKNRVVAMMLIHEAGEALIGDIIPQDGVKADVKSDLEYNAVRSIFSQLDESDYLINLWLEFEKGDSQEALFARDLDKFEMALQANLYSVAFDKNLEEFKKSAEKSIKNEELLSVVRDLLK